MKKLGKYEILEEIGRGGFAVVYKARDTTLDRVVALKILHPQLTIDPKFVQRFHQEARTAARFHHPHIVTIHEVGEEAGQPYLAMAFLSGWTLDRLLAGRVMPVEGVVSIVEQIAGALDTIHRRGLVHRDVKPANIMVDESGQATLLDFGIVRAAEGTRLTTTMAVLGTPEYMSPELAAGEEPDARSDIYALGVVAYQMLTGQAPFSAPSPLALLRFHVDEEPPSPRELNPGLSAAIEQVLLKALAKRREDRYQSAGELARALREAVEGTAKTPHLEPRPVVSQPPGRPDLKSNRPTPWRWIAGAGIVAVALVAVVLVLIGGGGGDGKATDTPNPVTLEKPDPAPTNTSGSEPPTPSRVSPEQAVRDYYALIIQREYHLTWSRLTENFKSSRQPPLTYDAYVEWWDTVRQVNIDRLHLDEETPTYAALTVEISYVRFSQPTYDDIAKIHLIYDSSNQQWMFDFTKSLK